MIRQRDLGFLLKGVTRLYVKSFERHASSLGLSLSQCKVLIYLSRNEGISQTRLAELTETDPMTLVRILDRMEQDQWIERRPDPTDRRAHCLYLLNEVKPVMARIHKVSDLVREQAFDGLSEADRERLMHLLDHVHTSLSPPDAEKPAPSAQRRKA